jgi:hypothetical protein
MHIFEIILLTAGVIVAIAGLRTLIRANRYVKPISVRRFDDF